MSRASRIIIARRLPAEPPAPPPADQVRRGVLGVMRRAGRLLLIQRAIGVRVGGLWCFPGGHIEPDEPEAEALVREMREELGLEVRAGRRLLTLRKYGGQLLLYTWSATIVSGRLTPDPREVAATRWMTPAQMRRMRITSQAVPLEAPPHLITGTLTILRRLGL